MAVDKGAINWGHVLVLPIEHHRCGLALPPATHAEMMRFLSALRTCYAAKASNLGCNPFKPQSPAMGQGIMSIWSLPRRGGIRKVPMP